MSRLKFCPASGLNLGQGSGVFPNVRADGKFTFPSWELDEILKLMVWDVSQRQEFAIHFELLGHIIICAAKFLFGG